MLSLSLQKLELLVMGLLMHCRLTLYYYAHAVRCIANLMDSFADYEFLYFEAFFLNSFVC